LNEIMRRHGFTRTTLILTLVALLGPVTLVALILYPIYVHDRDAARRSTCQQNLRNVGLAIHQYARDNDGVLPPVVGTSGYYGWADAIQPNVKTPEPFQCPGEYSSTVPPDTVGFSDYFYNRNVQSRALGALDPAARIIMLGDGPPTDARSSANGCAAPECAPGESGHSATLPGGAMRHKEGANYVFVDGHVKWLKGLSDTQAAAIKSGNTPPSAEILTFGIK